ncbi:MAG TPA: hypothetical protein DIU07_22325 [Rhodobacteraceae bacterium]|nr:hypothetical protein [Paracoccaceae bacterium]
MPLRLLHLAALLGIPAVAVTLWAWGQPLTSQSGELSLWVNSIWSSETSQQVADWYTLSHIIHGMLIALIGKALIRWIGFAPFYLVAIVTGVGWEIVEHTDWVLDRFRSVTLYQGYLGDTVLNAAMDYVFMMGGFYVASWARPLWTGALIVVMELGSGLIARDNLTLTTINTFHPVEAIQTWQDEINPRTHPAHPDPAQQAK